MSRTAFGVMACIGTFACITLLGAGQAEEKAAPTSTKTEAKPAKIDFNREIRPILADHCYTCHGPDDKVRQGKFRLDRKKDAFKGLESGIGFAIVPGEPAQSEIFDRANRADNDKRKMPPTGKGKPLAKEQIELLRKWIEQGADWKEHWAYVAPKRPALPEVKNTAWPKNGLDRFILARLEKEGLKPGAEADRPTLIRRLSLDLTGLPPTPAEVDAFVADQSANAYEKVVDRLLASPHFGERMAMHWLDLARYADTNGYHIDNHRDMWKWREWVIDSFNKNKPFDEFTIEQLAGDLLPKATLEQKVGSGFNRNTMVTFEGGADPNEYQTKYVVDRVVTTATVWLGTTLACTECHDHKYDPFTQKEFYQLYAFFNNIPEKGLDGSKTNPVPSIKVPTKEQTAKLEELRKQLKELDDNINKELAAADVEEPEYTLPDEHQDYVWLDDQLPAGAKPNGDEGSKSWKWVESPVHPAYSGRSSVLRTTKGVSQQYFDAAIELLHVGAGDKLFAHVYLDPANPPKTIMLQFKSGDFEHRAYWGESKIEFGKEGRASRLPMGPLPALGRWVRLEVDANKINVKPGAKIDGLAFTQFGGTVYWDRAGIVSRMPQGAQVSATQAAWEEWEKIQTGSSLPGNILKIVRTAPEKRKDKETEELRLYYLRNVSAAARKLFGPLFTEYERIKKEETKLNETIPETMVMEDMAKRRDTFVLVRGDFQNKGEKVEPALPSILPPLPEGSKADRLGLAKWLVSPEHPLTARVTVNRWWEQVFGIGLVRTSEDFGSQGEWPSHPELLDWLAVEFMESKWDIKAFSKLLVTSATYRQSTKVTPEVLKKDPENRLLSRGPRFRMSAEMIRDNALAVSGLLNSTIGGPSVKPYQPVGLWEQVSIGGSFSSQSYKQDKGADLYRRGMYTYWKRSLPHPSLVAFDAPNREVCADRRPRTNTPLQAFVLLNDPIYVECARVLGQRVMQEGGKDQTARLTYAFKLCTARVPTDKELKILERVFDQQLAKFKNDPKAAEKLIGVGESPRPKELDVSELATWTAIGNILLNLDETITKG